LLPGGDPKGRSVLVRRRAVGGPWRGHFNLGLIVTQSAMLLQTCLQHQI
jgi:hypothetical protein